MKKNLLSFLFSIILTISFAQTTQRLSPDFTAFTLDNDTMTLSDILLQQQKYVALEFFFNESLICMETSPLVTEAYQNLGNNQTDVIFISINIGNDSTQCRKYQDSLSLQVPIIAGTKGGNEIAEAYNIQSFPTLILISPSIPDTLIGLDSVKIDTIINEVDTTIYEHYNYQYNIVENDIWPITSAQDIITVLTSYHGITGVKNEVFGETSPVFTLYPNPSKGNITIDTKKLKGRFDYQIIDISGKVIYHDELNLSQNEKTQLYFNWLSTGIYFLQLQNEDTLQIQKLIIR